MTATGRHGRAELCFTRGEQRTILRRHYTTLPARVIRPFYLAGDGRAYVYLLTPTGGMLGGDALDIRLVLEAGAQVCLTTASATKVHPSVDQPAQQSLRIELASESTLEYLPEPTILFRQARWQQRTVVQRAADSRLVLAEAWSAGRVARGEVFQFSYLDTTLEITTASTLSVFDRMQLTPVTYPHQRLGLWGARPHLLSMYVLQEQLPTSAWLHELQTAACPPSATLGASQLQASGVVIRTLIEDAETMQHVYAWLWRRIRQDLWGEPWFPWRK